MVGPTLEGCEAKLRWSRHHLDTLRNEEAAFLARHPYEIVGKMNMDTGRYVCRVRGLKEPEPHWAMIIGDCLYQMRSTLDNLVYQLAILGQGRDLTDEDAASCMFPIFSDPSKWTRNGQSRVRLLRDGEQTRIRELQPFNAWNESIWGAWGPHSASGPWPKVPASIPGALERLNALENIDEHRHPHPVWFGLPDPVAAGFTFKQGVRILSSTVSGQHLENDAEVGSIQFARPFPELPDDMDVKRYFPIGIGFVEPAIVQGAIPQLESMAGVVATVVEVFRPCIEQRDPALALAKFA